MAYQNPEKPVHFCGTKNATPAPTKETAWSRKNYGANAYGGASSDMPGKRTISPLAADLESGDAVLAAVRANGVQKDDSGFQVRAESDKVLPTTFGCKPSTPDDTPKV
jgi:hypothetical protein